MTFLGMSAQLFVFIIIQIILISASQVFPSADKYRFPQKQKYSVEKHIG